MGHGLLSKRRGLVEGSCHGGPFQELCRAELISRGEIGLRWVRTLDLGAMHDTARLPIEGIASVHGRAIVPEQEIADAPPVHIPEIGPFDMRPERIKQCFRFCRRKTFNAGVAPPAEIKARRARRGMTANSGMPSTRRLVRIVCGFDPLTQVAAAIVGAVVFDAATSYLGLQWFWEGNPSRMHAANPGVATHRGHLKGVEHGGVRWQLKVAHVGVPDRLSRPKSPQGLTLFVHHIRDHVNVGIPWRAQSAMLLDRWRVEFSEPPAEREKIVVGQLLPTEQQCPVPMPGALDLHELCIAYLGKIDTGDFSADRRG
jgi:hypothetical protein